MTGLALPPVPASQVAAALNEVLARVRPGSEPVTEETPLEPLGLESIDYVEVFIVIEERTGAVFDLSVAPSPLEIVADLARYRRVE